MEAAQGEREFGLRTHVRQQGCCEVRGRVFAVEAEALQAFAAPEDHFEELGAAGVAEGEGEMADTVGDVGVRCEQ